MRFRVKGPTGQSIITLGKDTTLRDLKHAITKETAISSFEIRTGYPPKTLDLDRFREAEKLSDTGMKLDGEQLLVISKEPATSRHTNGSVAEEPSSTTKHQKISHAEASSSRASAPVALPGKFSFGDLGPSSSSAGGARDLASMTTKGDPAADLSLTRKSNAEILNDPPELVLAEHGGTLVLRIMPDDNSCLFRALALAMMPGLDTMNELRSVVAQTIQAHPEVYSKAVLDNKDPDDYCRWIQTEDAWGGQIELNIISNHFDIEIASIDVQGLRVDRYNEGRPKRCIIVYSGIHYDAVALSPFDSPPDFDTTVFDTSETDILSSAVELCHMLKDRGYYTDTAAFKIQCKECGAVCTGEVGATEHAAKTGHYRFDQET